METTTYLGNGLGGARRKIELPAVGQIVKTWAGSPRTRDLREVVGRVTDHVFRTISGTEYGVWELVIENGQERVQVGAGRLQEITVTEVIAFEAVEKVSEAVVAAAATQMTADGASAAQDAPWVAVGYVAAARSAKTGKELTAYARRAARTAQIRLAGGNEVAALLASGLTARVLATC
ncbi:hypothetical protein ACIRPQ_29385 [Streptomyces sp. NPDC101213]|uniref:hypothetical protein n=1 Tax=Streptomyces sp. NPDC101213 TaxID=3366130 RepID=UPI0037F9339E